MLKQRNLKGRAFWVIFALSDFCWHSNTILNGLTKEELNKELDAAGMKLYREDNLVRLDFNNEETKL